MRNILIFIAVFSTLMPAPAQAEWRKVSKWLGLQPQRAEWGEYTRYTPYLENGKHAHPVLLQDDSWKPADWTAQRRNGLDLVSGYYKADIIRNQHVEDGTSVITVGPNFYRLGGLEKQRIIASMNDVYGITSQKSNGVILLRDWYTHHEIGVFTPTGLMLQ